jgi:glycosyltransferase involved in cell wall biosynthesis
MDLSVAIITLNEAANIGACLQSVRGASQIVVVDQFSSDSTVEIARSQGAEVYQEEWKGYAGQKNSALAKARCSWVLSLDADERVTPQLWREIQRVVNEENDFRGYFVKRRNFFCGKWIRRSGWYPDYTLRLFRRNAGQFEGRAVHEKVTVDGKVGYLEHPLEHHTYRSVADYLARMERYSRLAAREIRGRGKNLPGWPALLFRPMFTFVKMYGLKRGFMDGKPGFFLAVSYAYYTFLKYYRLLEADCASADSPKAATDNGQRQDAEKNGKRDHGSANG